MNNEIIPYPGITLSDKEGYPNIPEGINERALKMMGCNSKDIRIVCGGRGKGKMMAFKEFLKLLPDIMREDVVIIRASDPVPELRGNKRPRIEGYDMLEISASTWRLWEELMGKTKKHFK